MFCSKCGNQIREHANFCVSCGTSAEREDSGAEVLAGDVSAGNTNDAEKAVSMAAIKSSDAVNKGFVATKNIISFKPFAILAIVAVLVLIFAGAALSLGEYFRVEPIEIVKDTVVDVANLQHQILSIGELATLEYNYKDVITLKDSHSIRGWNIPLTQKSFIITLEGTMKIGIDASDISINASEHTRTISLTVPKAKILSHELHEGTVEVLEETSGLFNPVSIDDWTAMAVAKKQDMEDKVFESDMLVRAENDAVRMLQALIVGVVPEGYTVNVTRR